MNYVIEPYRTEIGFCMPYHVKMPARGLKCINCNGTVKKPSLFVSVMYHVKGLSYCYDSTCFWNLMKRGSNTISENVVLDIDSIANDERLEFLAQIQAHNSRLHNQPDSIAKKIFLNTPPFIPHDKTPRKVVIWSKMKCVPFKKGQNGICVLCEQRNNPNTMFRFLFQQKYFHFECLLQKAEVFIGSPDFAVLRDSVSAQEIRKVEEQFREAERKMQPTVSRDLFQFIDDERRVLFLSTINVKPITSQTIDNFPCTSCKKCANGKDKHYMFFYNSEFWHCYCLFEDCAVICERPEVIIGWSDLAEEVQRSICQWYMLAIALSSCEAYSLPRIGDEEEDEEMVCKKRKRKDKKKEGSSSTERSSDEDQVIQSPVTTHQPPMEIFWPNFFIETIFKSAIKGNAANSEQVFVYNGNLTLDLGINSRSYNVFRAQDGTLYQALLMNVNVQFNQNTSLELFILKSHDITVYYERKMRIGTSLREDYETIFGREQEAVKYFEQRFLEYTGCEWRKRSRYAKVPGKFTYVQTECDNKLPSEWMHTALHRLSGHIHEDEMTLHSIQSKFKFYGELEQSTWETITQELLSLMMAIENGSVTEELICRTSDNFYSLFPTNFGFESPVLLSTIELVRKARTSLRGMPKRVEINGDPRHRTISLQSLDYLNSKLEKVEKYSNSYNRILREYYIPFVPIMDRNSSLFIFKMKHENKNFLMGKTSMWVWHATSKDKILRILEEGLTAATDSHEDHLFGGGIHFSNSFTRTMKYVEVSSPNDHYFLLCQVNPGRQKAVDSEKGISQEEVDTILQDNDSIIVTEGTTSDDDDTKCEKGTGSSNKTFTIKEYIVYDPCRINIEYIAKQKTQLFRKLD